MTTSMDDIANRLLRLGSEESLKWDLRDLGSEAATEIARLRALSQNNTLRAALEEMLETHGKPRHEEWLNEAAFEHAKAVDERARRALEQARKE